MTRSNTPDMPPNPNKEIRLGRSITGETRLSSKQKSKRIQGARATTLAIQKTKFVQARELPRLLRVKMVVFASFSKLFLALETLKCFH